MGNKIKTFLLVFLIVAFGFFLRFYNIENVPPGVYPDEAANGMDALNSLNSGHFQWFYPDNQGREGLFMNLIALCFNFFGASITTLRLPSIIFSTLSILGIYLLGKEMFSRRIGLISSFLMAFSFWSINFGRISFRANMLPVILAFSFYFLFRGLKTKNNWNYVWSGLIFGLGMHSYIAWRISPLILILAIIPFALSREKFFRNHWKKISIFIFCSIIVATPMFWTFYSHPEYFESRTEAVSIFSPAINKGDPSLAFLQSFSLSLIKFNFVGDMNWRHNFPPYPVLDIITGIGFLFGIIFSFVKTIEYLKERIKNKIRHGDLEKYSFLIIWFFVMLAPEFMTGEGLPHALRSIGTLPVVMIFSAITFDFLLKKSENYGFFGKKITYFLITFSMIFIGVFNSIKYHIVWAKKERVAFSFNKNDTEISKYVNQLPKEQEKFFITSYNGLERYPIKIFHMEQNNTYLYPNELDKVNPKNPNDFIVFFTEKNDDAINHISKKFPYLQFDEIRNDPGSIYYTLRTK